MRTIGRFLTWVLGLIIRLVMLAVLPPLIILIVNGAHEVTHRQTTLRTLHTEIERLEIAMLQPGDIDRDQQDLVEHLRESRARYDRASADVHRGDPTMWTDVVARWDLWTATRHAERAHGDTMDPPSSKYLGDVIESIARIPAGQSTDVLLVIATTSSGLFGALIAGFRRDDLHLLHHLLLGVGVGFLTYLLIRGGRGVFFVDDHAGSFDMNVYGLLLLALIAGVFADRLVLTLIPPRQVRGTSSNTARDRRATTGTMRGGTGARTPFDHAPVPRSAPWAEPPPIPRAPERRKDTASSASTTSIDATGSSASSTGAKPSASDDRAT